VDLQRNANNEMARLQQDAAQKERVVSHKEFMDEYVGCYRPIYLREVFWHISQ
jgi:hypothetical protein